MKNKNVANSLKNYGVYLILLIGCIILFSHSFFYKKPQIFSEEKQSMMSPEQILQDLIEGNKRFCANKPLRRKSLVEKAQIASAQGQFPKAVILGCMDSRSIPEIIFDQTIGDIFTLRVAGNVVNEDILASLEYATKIIGSKVILIMGHTKCGAIQAACTGNVSGNLKALIRTIQPAVAQVEEQHPDQPLDCADGVTTRKIAIQNVRNMIQRIIKGSPVIDELLEQGSIKLVGALHDLDTGIVTFDKPVSL